MEPALWCKADSGGKEFSFAESEGWRLMYSDNFVDRESTKTK